MCAAMRLVFSTSLPEAFVLCHEKKGVRHDADGAVHLPQLVPRSNAVQNETARPWSGRVPGRRAHALPLGLAPLRCARDEWMRGAAQSQGKRPREILRVNTATDKSDRLSTVTGSNESL